MEDVSLMAAPDPQNSSDLGKQRNSR